MMKYNYTDLFNNLHEYSKATIDTIQDAIELGSDGKLIIPKNFDTEIASTKDYRSNVVLFKVPSNLKNYSLLNCSIKAIEWTNLTSKLHGATKIETNSLGPSGDAYPYFYLEWVIAPETHTEAGELEISLVFGDRDGDGNINFLWHSDILKGLKVSRSIEAPGFYDNTGSNLAQIIAGTKQIYLPRNFNRIIGSKGDVNSNKITFQCDQIINGYDLLDNGTECCIRWSTTDGTKDINRIDKIIELDSYNSEFGGLIQFDWILPPDLCSHPGNFSFNVCFFKQETKEGNGEITFPSGDGVMKEENIEGLSEGTSDGGEENTDEEETIISTTDEVKYLFKWSTLDNNELSIANGITDEGFDGAATSSTSVTFKFMVNETEIENMLNAAFPAENTEV